MWVVVVEIGVGLGFVFTGLVVGGVFLGFCRGGWSIMEVEIGVAVEIDVVVFVFQEKLYSHLVDHVTCLPFH